MKRLFYYGIICYTQISFRSFIEPLGFNLFCGHNLCMFEEFLEISSQYVLKYDEPKGNPLLDIANNSNNQNEKNSLIKHLRNYRNEIQQLTFGSGFIETQDKRRLRAIIASIFSNRCLDDQFSFLEPESEEKDLWIPQLDNLTLQQIMQKISLIPTFPSTDALMTVHSSSMALCSWNLSRWVSEPFISINESSPVQYSYEEAVENLNKFAETLPDFLTPKLDQVSKPQIYNDINISEKQANDKNSDEINDSDSEIQQNSVFSSPLFQFWINETNDFNFGLGEIKTMIEDQNEVIMKDIMAKRVPEEWKELMHMGPISSLSEFISEIDRRKDQIVKAFDNLINHTDCQQTEIVLKYIHNPQSFISAFLEQEQINQNNSNLMLEFIPIVKKQDINQCQTSDDSLQKTVILKNLYLFNGSFEAGKLSPVKEKPFVQFDLFCRTILKQQFSEKKYFCPMFKTPFLSGQMNDEEITIVDSETKNYITDIILPSNGSDRHFLLNGTSIYCRLPSQFC